MAVEDVDSIYGHDALVLYLQDVRDLEVMNALFKSKIVEGDRTLEDNRRKYLTPYKVPLPKQSSAGQIGSVIGGGYLIYLIVVTVGFTLYYIANVIAGKGEQMGNVFGMAPIVLIIFLLYRALKKSKNKRTSAYKEAVRHNIEDDKRLAKNREMFPVQFEQPWAQRRSFLVNACAKIQSALEQDYALNITPLQYRTLKASIYLYDFMSTSQQPFSQALDHAQFDDGIQRIEAKLNVIINQNEQMLRQLTQINANTQTLIQQGNAILAEQVATTHYASVAAAHARSIDTKLGNMQDYVRYGF